jgi:hypothetical protein
MNWQKVFFKKNYENTHNHETPWWNDWQTLTLFNRQKVVITNLFNKVTKLSIKFLKFCLKYIIAIVWIVPESRFRYFFVNFRFCLWSEKNSGQKSALELKIFHCVSLHSFFIVSHMSSQVVILFETLNSSKKIFILKQTVTHYTTRNYSLFYILIIWNLCKQST